jgi:putative RecB family exonuclease
MTIYSHNRLSCFEQCPLKYKLSYIDELEAKKEENIEAYLGKRVHEVLEKLYRDMQNKKENTIDDLLQYLHDEWEKLWDDSIIIINKKYKPENYEKKAMECIKNYYNSYKPFNQDRTIGIEQHILISLDDTGKYTIQGYIDRLAETQDGYYEIHDYKTTSRRIPQKDLNNDRQMALYAIGVKENFPEVKDIELVWHFLTFDKEMRSKREAKKLDQLKNDIIKLIDLIEEIEDFPTFPSFLCNWCDYKQICRE